MLKKLRVFLSIVFFTLITFYFIDFAGWLPDWFHVLGHIQLIPAIVAGMFGIVLFIIVLTLLFGRIYCSSICPMGVFQDIVAWFSKRTAKKKKRYRYSPSKNILRISVLGVIIIAFLFGFTALLGLLDPYSAYGRMAVHLFKPVYAIGNNLLEAGFTRFNNEIFYKEDIGILSPFSFIVASVTFLVIGFLAWRNGRTFCNTVCPAGTLLGFIGNYSLFKIRFDAEKCNRCGLCNGACKASCINTKEQTIDNNRCVDCFNCLKSCKQNALNFTHSFQKTQANQSEKQVNTSRRRFFLTGLTTAVSASVLPFGGKTGLFTDEKIDKRKTPVAPPGAGSHDRLLRHCTACHLCIAKCPSNVLKPAFLEYGLGGIMQPMMSFDRGYCDYDCTVCSNVCPTGALIPLTKEEKHRTQPGRVVFNKEICMVTTDEIYCGDCADYCPTQAIRMVPYKERLTIPSIETDLCIGCGGCEYICSERAIFVEGNKVHQKIKNFLLKFAHSQNYNYFCRPNFLKE